MLGPLFRRAPQWQRIPLFAVLYREALEHSEPPLERFRGRKYSEYSEGDQSSTTPQHYDIGVLAVQNPEKCWYCVTPVPAVSDPEKYRIPPVTHEPHTTFSMIQASPSCDQRGKASEETCSYPRLSAIYKNGHSLWYIAFHTL